MANAPGDEKAGAALEQAYDDDSCSSHGWIIDKPD
jgi:hypothetical protein